MALKRKKLLITIVVIVVLIFVARFTGIYQFYNIPTGSMEPTLSPGKRILTTNLKSPKRNGIILFTRKVNDRFENDPNGKENTFCSRLIAMGGDTLQIKNGLAYVNGVLVDDTSQLKFTYFLSGKNYPDLITALEIDVEKDKYGDFTSMGDSAYATLSGTQYDQVKNVIHLERRTSFMMADTTMYPGKGWTIDNFGPYVIPAHHFFVMGDNRHNAMDSRYVGPVPSKNYKGSLLMKF